MTERGEIKRVLTGMRPTGRLHLGHYLGALKLWLEVQEKIDWECFFLIADVQALTTHADQPELIRESIREVVLDWLAVGLDPDRTNVNFVLQSGVKSRFAISEYLLMLSNLSEIQRNPTIKGEGKGIRNPSMGFMTYPVDQAADILMVSPEEAEKNKLFVPVGEDQVPHLEYCRVLARRFNKMYKTKVFSACTAKVGEVGRLVGIDGGEKMSKSKNNAIYLSDTVEEVEAKVRRMFTDPKRVHSTDPGTVEGNPVFIYLDAFATDKSEVDDFKVRYRRGTVGDVEIKTRLAEILNEFLEPIRERRQVAEKRGIKKIVIEGTEKAEKLAQEVLAKMEEAMCLGYTKREHGI